MAGKHGYIVAVTRDEMVNSEGKLRNGVFSGTVEYKDGTILKYGPKDHLEVVRQYNEDVRAMRDEEAGVTTSAAVATDDGDSEFARDQLMEEPDDQDEEPEVPSEFTDDSADDDGEPEPTDGTDSTETVGTSGRAARARKR